MQIKKDYVDYKERSEYGSDGIYTVSLITTFGTKKDAELFAQELESVKQSLEKKVK